MASKLGRPPVKNPKDQRLQVRVDKSTIETLDFCAKELHTNRSNIVRMGVELVLEKIDGQK